MKKIAVLLIFAGLLAGCSTSPYVGNWQAPSADGKTTYDLMLNEDGSAVAKWYDGDQSLTKSGTWKDAGDGSIILNGINTSSSARLDKERLILTTKRKIRHHFTRKVARHAHKQ